MSVSARFEGGPLDGLQFVLPQSRPPGTLYAARTIMADVAAWSPTSSPPATQLAAPGFYALGDPVPTHGLAVYRYEDVLPPI